MPLPLSIHMKNTNKIDFTLCQIPQEPHQEHVRTVLLNLSMTGRHDPRGGGCDTPRLTRPGNHQIPDSKLNVN
eukprot:372916-Rhodomonas_salina.1